MKITDTLEQIIEKVEPYMDKTLSEWCIIVQCEKSDNDDLKKYNYKWGIYTQITYIKYLRDSTSKNSEFDFWWDQISLDFNWQKTLWKHFWKKYFYPEDDNDFQYILWHYDITAVEKYIHKNRKELNIQVPWIYFKNWRRCLKYFVLWKWFLEYYFPNKPLHLYTEEENKDLLKILKELWNKN